MPNAMEGGKALDRRCLDELALCQEMSRHANMAQMIVSKRSGCVQHANRKARKLWPFLAARNECQTSVEEIIDSHTWTSHEKQEVLGQFRNLTARSEPFEVECSVPSRAGGDASYHRLTFTPCVHPVTGEDAVTISELDVSDLRKVESRLVEELKAQELTFNSISHELRAPLSGIVGLTDAALMSNDQVPTHLRKSLKVIKATGQRMSGLVNDLLDAVSTRHSKLVIKHEMCNLREIAQEVIDIMTPLARRNVQIHNRVCESLPRIEGDSRRISQILTNLLSNACKFTSKGSITVDAEQRRDMIVMTVEDTGLGIPADKLESIFGAFQQVDESTTRKYGGTGLGLTLVKSLVEAHHGSIRVSSVFGAEHTGTTFTLELPLEQDETKDAELSQPSSTSSTFPALQSPERGASFDCWSMSRESSGIRAASEDEADQARQAELATAQAEELRSQVQRLTAELRERESELRACQQRLTSAEEALLVQAGHRELHEGPRQSAHTADTRASSASSLPRTRSSDDGPASRSSSVRSATTSSIDELERTCTHARDTSCLAPGLGVSAQRAGRCSSSVSSSSSSSHGCPAGHAGLAVAGGWSRTSSSTVSASPPLQGVLLQHMLEREELLERKLLATMHSQRAEMDALRAENDRRSLRADSILSSINIKGAAQPRGV